MLGLFLFFFRVYYTSVGLLLFCLYSLVCHSKPDYTCVAFTPMLGYLFVSRYNLFGFSSVPWHVPHAFLLSLSFTLVHVHEHGYVCSAWTECLGPGRRLVDSSDVWVFAQDGSG